MTMMPMSIILPVIAFKLAVSAYVLSAYSGMNMNMNMKLTCDRYVLNAYLFATALATATLAGAAAIRHVRGMRGVVRTISRSAGVLTFVGLVAWVIATALVAAAAATPTSSTMTTATRAGLVALYLAMSTSLVAFVVELMEPVSNKFLVVTAALAVAAFAVPGVIGGFFGDRLGDRAAAWLAVGLVVFFSLEFLAYLILGAGSSFEKVVMFLGLAAVCAVALLHARGMSRRARDCHPEKNPPNYPAEGIRIHQTLLNMFKRILLLRGGGRRR